MRATSRSIAGILLRWYAVLIMRSTMPAISGRSDHTIAESPPGPSGMSMRATARVYGRVCLAGLLVAFEVLELDEEREHEADVRAGERVVVGGTLGRAGVHVDDRDAFVARLARLRAVHDRLELRDRRDLQAEVVHRRRPQVRITGQEVYELRERSRVED